MEKPEISENTQTIKWQYRLLPFMIKTIIALMIFFFVASLGQFIYLQINIKMSPDLPKEWTQEKNIEKQLCELEYLVINKRYHQGETSLMSRIWLHYLGFVTGMILALIGAIFILGKLRENESKLNLDVSSVKVSLISSSPGLFLALLGTVIMITTILDHKKIDITDTSIYINRLQEAVVYPTKTPVVVPTQPDTTLLKDTINKKGDQNAHPPIR